MIPYKSRQAGYIQSGCISKQDLNIIRYSSSFFLQIRVNSFCFLFYGNMELKDIFPLESPKFFDKYKVPFIFSLQGCIGWLHESDGVLPQCVQDRSGGNQQRDAWSVSQNSSVNAPEVLQNFRLFCLLLLIKVFSKRFILVTVLVSLL